MGDAFGREAGRETEGDAARGEVERFMNAFLVADQGGIGAESRECRGSVENRPVLTQKQTPPS
ncbi:hypothetical protein MWN33_00665 [Starkeya koreensis]|uniref:Uncharacterized protein n=1 Tax=Ancylobacter koreensis TaxID=266121 RepID=A0ABT0DGY1_9HYPH|nr:hypothetical protein [Ancylobacter koreensis]MCK0206542.1 hypothetical protein [Ancylobacter koreensis]